MSESFRQANGRKVVSRASAQELGTVSHLLIDGPHRSVAAVVVGRGRRARLVDWAALSGFGPDAVMVADEGALRTPADAREQAAADGKLELVGRRALTEFGNELGIIDDVTFNPRTGALETLRVADRDIDAAALLGSGSFAAVLDKSQESLP